jgi:hypothetical protein
LSKLNIKVREVSGGRSLRVVLRSGRQTKSSFVETASTDANGP